jgi:hypothetical protein
MESPVVSLPTLDELQSFVRETLCGRDHLDPGQAMLKQAVIRRGCRACGLFFQVLGQQRQRAYAIWASDDHRILFYDASGARFNEVNLSDEPDAAELNRQAA